MKKLYFIVLAFLASGSVAAAAPADHPHKAYAGATPLVYTPNHGSPVQLLSAAAIVAKLQGVLTKFGGVVQSNNLVTYGAYRNSPKIARRVDTDPLRDVYVVTSSFPNGLTSRHGRWSRATMTSVYDAQTGAVLQFSVSGTLAQSR